MAAVQPLPSCHEPNDIEFADPDCPFVPKLLIADILRTRYCIPGSVFLVEGVEAVIPVGSLYRTVRLLLGDGALCIQALVRPEMYGFVDGGQVYPGCYVRIDRFELKARAVPGPREDVEDDGVADPQARVTREEQRVRQRREKPKTMVFLLVEDLMTVGWNTAYMKLAEEQPPNGAVSNGGPVAGGPYGDKSATLSKAGQDATTSRPMTNDTGDESDPDSDFEQMEVSLPKATQRRLEAQNPQPAARLGFANYIKRQDNSQLPWASSDPTQPLRLTTLRSIPSLPYKQNWTVNVLAVVASLSDLEPSHLPPHQQRSVRLADPTTSKQVLLTVFLDPAAFAPKVGSVVLLLGVKNHRFDGGSLKKYASERPKSGTRWWLEDPWDLEWCDVVGLKRWWAERGTVA